MDTEGTAGKDSDEFAQLTSSVGNLDLIDLYCFWGGDQYKSFVKLNKSIESALKVTGCPRYDFCNEKLQPILSKISNICVCQGSSPFYSCCFQKNKLFSTDIFWRI